MSTTIRGTRVNLAAAICWENYMPLVRQSLYAQNVNLYLAPTADGRDAWLSLMRTVAIEGRCFVASSNMAARAPGSAVQKQVANGATPELSPKMTDESGDRAGRSRRRSIPCGDGNEIILADGYHRSARPSQSLSSWNSVVYEDGSETAPSERPVPPRRPHRRSSILCADGKEMPYPPSISSWPPGPDPESPGAELAPPKRPAGAPRPVAPAWSGTSREWVSRGGSCIVGPFGDVLAGPQWEDDEGIIYADLDFDDCIRGRLDLDTAGSYSRYVYPRPLPCVSTLDGTRV